MVTQRPPLEEMTLRQLRRIASRYGISRYSRMRKSQLLASIREMESSPIANSPLRRLEAQEEVEAAKFNLGQENLNYAELVSVDEGLADLPDGYGDSRIVMMSRDPLWAYVYWDISNEHKEQLRAKGGQQLALRVYDVTGLNPDDFSPQIQTTSNMQEYPCDELARDWYLPIPISDRDYLVEIGYRCPDDRWLVLARSNGVRIPPVHPSDWVEDHFIEVSWGDQLQEEPIYVLNPPEDLLYPILEPIFKASDYWSSYAVGSNHAPEEETLSSFQHTPGSLQFAYWTEFDLDLEAVPDAPPQVSGYANGWGTPQTQKQSAAWLSPDLPDPVPVLAAQVASSSLLNSPARSSSVSSAWTSGKPKDCSAFMPALHPQQVWLTAEADLVVYGLNGLSAHPFKGLGNAHYGSLGSTPSVQPEHPKWRSQPPYRSQTPQPYRVVNGSGVASSL